MAHFLLRIVIVFLSSYGMILEAMANSVPVSSVAQFLLRIILIGTRAYSLRIILI